MFGFGIWDFMNLALLGFPLAHSLSPAMHNAALADVGLRDWRYEATPIEPTRLAEAVAVLRGGDYAGANVTVPHKETIIPFLDGLTPVADAIGAVNTIIKRKPTESSSSPSVTMETGTGGEVLIGHNTDAAGLADLLSPQRSHLKDRPVLILGAGGNPRGSGRVRRRGGARARSRPAARAGRSTQGPCLACGVRPYGERLQTRRRRLRPHY